MRFSLYTVRHFQKSKSGAETLFMKIQVGIVHFVTRAHKLCYKAALCWPIDYAFASAPFGIILSICMQNAFFSF